MSLLAGTTVVIADDAPLFRRGVRGLLEEYGAHIVGEAVDGPGLRRLVDGQRPALVVTDIRMPPGEVEGLSAALDIKRVHAQTAIILLSNHAETRYLRQILAGARAGVGYLLKERVVDTDDFLDSVERVLAGRTMVDPEIASLLVERTRWAQHLEGLTDRERAVLTEVATGASNTAIGRHLTMSVKTVETHIQRIFTKLELYEDPDTNRRVRAVLKIVHGLETHGES